MLRFSPSRLLLLGAWVIALAGVIVISRVYVSGSTSFVGVADDQEHIISFPSPVTVALCDVVSGQKVTAGDVLAQMQQPALEARLEMVQEQIHALTNGQRESTATMRARIVEERARLQATLAELDSQINEVRARSAATRSILDSLGGARETPANTTALVQVENLQLRKRALRRAAAASINDLAARIDGADRPVDAKIAELEEEHRALNAQRKKLVVHAPFSGRIGSVMFKVGDTVPPFQPLLTVHSERPSFVRGYIHESVSNDVQLAQEVWLRPSSPENREQWYRGRVESLGARIVEYPDRLKVNTLTRAFGHEVIVGIDDQHALLLGEKVHIRLARPEPWNRRVRARLATFAQ